MGTFVNFFDGYDSPSTPIITQTDRLLNFANDAAFEAAISGAPLSGNIYYNTTDNKVRYYNGTEWREVADGTTLNDLIASIGQPNGVASLDGAGKVPTSQLPDAVLGTLQYQGVWNASTNTPTLGDSGSGGSKGHYYVVDTAGSTSVDGNNSWEISDWIVHNGTTWDKIDGSDAVVSVNGQTGVVTIDDSIVDINGKTEKDPVNDNDVILIEDSEDSFNKKKIKAGSIGNAKFLISYISDSAFQTANGVPPYTGKTGIYYNTTDDEVRFYNENTSSWQAVGGTTILKQEDLGFGNGVQVSYPLALTPINDEAVQVFLDGLIYEKSNYTITTNTLIFNTAPDTTTQIYVSYLTAGVQTATVVTISGSFIAENRVVTSGEITAKQLTLSNTPTNPNEVLSQVVDGVNLRNAVDYNITGDTFSWNGFGLDGLIEAGDVLTIWYFT